VPLKADSPEFRPAAVLLPESFGFPCSFGAQIWVSPATIIRKNPLLIWGDGEKIYRGSLKSFLTFQLPLYIFVIKNTSPAAKNIIFRQKIKFLSCEN